MNKHYEKMKSRKQGFLLWLEPKDHERLRLISDKEGESMTKIIAEMIRNRKINCDGMALTN